MVLQIHSTTPFTSKSYYWFHSCHQFKHNLTVQSQKSSEFSKPTTTNDADDNTNSATANPPKKPNSSGLGFGSASTANNPGSKKSGRRERASIVRRSPVEKPAFLLEKEEAELVKEQGKNESTFLLAWLGLGGIIFIEGIALAASGFLPEEWDNFFVKYLYPSFTPTVLLFVAGTVAYGVLKYIQNERITRQK